MAWDDDLLPEQRAAAAHTGNHARLLAGPGTGKTLALTRLIRNAARIADLPQPLRIADDWEERNVILEDLKSILNLKRISDAQDLLNGLSADWQSLTVDDADWERRFPNPRFLGVWREHRQIYGYTLRSELVYQLKKALEQRGDFELEGPIEYLLNGQEMEAIE